MSRNKRIKKEDLLNLVMEGKTDKEIGNILNISTPSIHYYRTKVYNIQRSSLRESPGEIYSHEQFEVLFGCTLGDGYMNVNPNSKSTGPSFICSHSLKQKEYLIFKSNFFKNSTIKEYYRNVPNKKTGKLYSCITMYLRVNRFLTFMYEGFYKNGIKYIPINMLKEYYTPLAMAIHYMDDGSKVGKSGYIIATCGFNRDNLVQFTNFLKEQYNLETSITKSNRVYIKHCSKDTFKNIISPFICDSMQYKI